MLEDKWVVLPQFHREKIASWTLKFHSRELEDFFSFFPCSIRTACLLIGEFTFTPEGNLAKVQRVVDFQTLWQWMEDSRTLYFGLVKDAISRVCK